LPLPEFADAIAVVLAIVVLSLLFAIRAFPERKLLHRAAGLVLLIVFSIMMGSCGGGGGGGGGGGSGGAVTIHVKVQGISGNLTVPAGTITITVP
jgi:hypothetical protein